MIDLRRIVIIFIIGVLYVVLSLAIIDALYPSPKYEDFCKQRFYPEKPYPAPDHKIECPAYNEPTPQQLENCSESRGTPDYVYDAKNCPVQYKGCNYCQRDFDAAQEKHSFYVFILSAILALIAVMVGLLLPTAANSLNEWIATGFLLGGLITLFYGTVVYYQHLGRYVKPLVILAELLIVIYLSYKKLQDIKTPQRAKKKR